MMNRPQDIRCEYPKGALMHEGLVQQKTKNIKAPDAVSLLVMPGRRDYRIKI
jgi:hypothetical protein